MVQAQSHSSQRRCSYADGSGDAFGILNRPFKNLHAANRSTDRQLQLLNTQRLDEHGLRMHDVAHIDERKRGTVRRPGIWIDRAGPGRSVTGSENVDTNDAVAFEIEQATGRKQLRPPRGHLCRTGERMTSQNRVLACFVQASVDGVVEGRVRKKLAALEGENFVDDKISLEGRLGDREHATVCGSAHRAASSSFLSAEWPLAAAIAWSRSARISRMSSIPTESLTISGVTPVAA